jgi:hypothetical protein
VSTRRARRAGALAVPVLALVLLAVLACAETGLLPGETEPPPSGIRGSVILGPTCPLDHEPGSNEPIPCLTPYAARLAVVDAEGQVATHVTSGADGRFEVTLPPGEYTVAPENGDPYPFAQSVPVVVVAGEYVEIQVNYDTGIR